MTLVTNKAIYDLEVAGQCCLNSVVPAFSIQNQLQGEIKTQ